MHKMIWRNNMVVDHSDIIICTELDTSVLTDDKPLDCE